MNLICYFTKGEGEDGKLGHNNRITLDKPKLIEALRSKRIRDIACGSSHSAAITTSGELYCWGLGEVKNCFLNKFQNKFSQISIRFVIHSTDDWVMAII